MMPLSPSIWQRISKLPETSARRSPEGDVVEEEPDALWSNMLPVELLREIIQRLEASEDGWPSRQNVVVFACVCKRWREVLKSTCSLNNNLGKHIITFPSCLKHPGPRDSHLQCLVRHDKKNSMFYLYLGLAPTFMDAGKFLLAARRCLNGEYILSLDPTDLSKRSTAYVGKLRPSDFFGANFVIYDTQPQHNFEVGQVSYKVNFWNPRGPRRIVCSLKSPLSSSSDATPCTVVLRNKPPRWHQQLQSWFLDFHDRMTVSSLKNFQLVTTLDEETIILQFGKVGDNMFTMDYRRPLSAFQAFAICLTSFGTKLAAE